MSEKFLPKSTALALASALLSALSLNTLADIALITHTSNPLQTLDITDARRMFLKQTSSFPDGSRAQVAMLEAQVIVRNDFERSVLKMSTSQLKTYWAQYIFSGQNRPPQEFDSEAAMRQWVAATPGALGYIHVTEVDDTIKVLKTIPTAIHRP